jgi:hypothetical protein
MQSQDNYSRNGPDFWKFLSWVTTPVLVMVSVIGICQIQLFVKGRK